MLIEIFLYHTPVQLARNLYLPGLEKKHFSYKTKILFHTSKIEKPIPYLWIRYIFVARGKFANQGLITEVKKIFALINNWENIIEYLEESKQSNALADKSVISSIL